MSNTDEIDHTKPSTFHESDVTPFDISTGDSNAKTSNISAPPSLEVSADKVNDAANNPKTKGWVQFEDDDDNKSPNEDNIPQMETVDLSEKVTKKFLSFFSYIFHVI